MAWSESNFYAACPCGPCDKGKISGGGCACQFGATNQSGAGDHSNGGAGPDLTLSTGPSRPMGSFTPPVAKLRGGFRYLNLFLEAGASEVEIAGVSVNFIAAPTAGADPSVYANHFHSSDDLLNQVRVLTSCLPDRLHFRLIVGLFREQIWYGCAYTTQLCSIDPAHGRHCKYTYNPRHISGRGGFYLTESFVIPGSAPATGWDNGAVIGTGDTLLVDGAKVRAQEIYQSPACIYT